jgi:hypothetical protein
MVKKIEKITEIMKEMEEYVSSHPESYSAKITELRKKYTTKQIIALIESFILPAYNEKCLREYVEGEVAKYNLIAALMPDQYDKVEATEEQKIFFIDRLTQICDILTNNL